MPDQENQLQAKEIKLDRVPISTGRSSRAITGAPKAMPLALMIGSGICYVFVQAFLRQLARRAGETSADFVADRLQPAPRPSREPLSPDLSGVRAVFVHQFTVWIRSTSDPANR